MPRKLFPIVMIIGFAIVWAVLCANAGVTMGGGLSQALVVCLPALFWGYITGHLEDLFYD